MSHVMLLTVVLGWGAVPNPEPVAVESVVPADVAPDADVPRFDFRIQTMHVTSMVHFEDNGRPRHQSGNLTMSIVVKHPPDIFVTSYSAFTIDRVVTSAGESLKVNHQNNRAQMIHNGMMGRGNRPPQFNVGITAELPRWSAARLSEIVGSVQVELAEGDVHEIDLGTFKEVQDRRIVLDAVPDCEITLTRQGDNQIQIEGSGQVARLLRNVQFFAPDGTELQCHGWGQHHGNQAPRWVFNVKLPDEGTLRVHLHPRSRTVTVPFLIRDTQLPRLPGAGGIGMLPLPADPRPAAGMDDLSC